MFQQNLATRTSVLLRLGMSSARLGSTCQRWSPTFGATPTAASPMESLERATRGVGGAQLPGEGANDGLHGKRDRVPPRIRCKTLHRLGRALDANVMLHLGAVLFAVHA